MDAPAEPEDGVIADQKTHLHWNLIYALEERIDEVINEIEVRLFPHYTSQLMLPSESNRSA